MTPKRILSLTGGGMKGLIECSVLAEIEKRSGRRIVEMFDLIAGTSAGGIIGCSLGAGNTAQQTCDFFTKDGPDIFQSSWLTGTKMMLRGYRFEPKPLESALQSRLGFKLMSDAMIPLIVPSYDRNTKSTVFFKSTAPDAAKYHMWEAARASSAAETYFPPFQLGDWSLWDGGTAANSPSVCALAEAVKMWGWGQDIKLLSLGCGGSVFAKQDASPGVISILKEIVGGLTESSDELSNYQCEQFLGADYTMIEPEVCTVGLADATPIGISRLQLIAKNTISNFSSEINQWCV